MKPIRALRRVDIPVEGVLAQASTRDLANWLRRRIDAGFYDILRDGLFPPRRLRFTIKAVRGVRTARFELA